MIRLVVALLGLAVIGAVFAGIYYAYPDESRAPFNLAPGEVESDHLQPAEKGQVMRVELLVQGSAIDVYVMEAAAAERLAESGLRLDRPFTYRAQWSRLNVTDYATIIIPSDGRTPMTIVLDNSDNVYNDTAPTGTASVQMVTRYPGEENRNLVLGYLAALPSLILVALTLARKIRRSRMARAQR